MRDSVSVIMPVKNGERFIREALQSILEQSYPVLEIIVVDAPSTDQTRAIVESFSQARYLIQQGKNSAAAHNEGVLAAKGDLISFLSHDDLWQKEKLCKQAHLLATRPDIDYAICRAKFFLNDPCYSAPGFRPHLLEEDHIAPIMETLLARRTLFDRVGLFDTAYSSFDVDWYGRVHDLGIQGGIVQEALLSKRIHDRNTTFCFTEYNQDLLQVLRQSIQRKKESQRAAQLTANSLFH